MPQFGLVHEDIASMLAVLFMPTKPAACSITTTCWRWPWMPPCAACPATWW
jgi:hypothetical protein